MTHRRTWQKAEQRVGRIFGVRRRRGSGSDPDTGGDDVVHPHLHVEVKYAKAHAAVAVYRKAEKKAEKEEKIPIVVLIQKGDRQPYVLLPLRRSALYSVMEMMKE